MRRHGECHGIYDCIDNNWTILIRERFRQTFSNVAGIFDANSLRAHSLSNLGEIWILEIHAEWNESGLLLFDMDEVELLVVENDLNYGSSSFHLGQQITDSHHCEASIAA